jgi:hypothetical protein
VRRAELLEQLLIGRRFFQRVQVGPVNVLHECVTEHRVVAGVPHDRRDDVDAQRLGGTPPALPHHDLVRPAARLPDHDRLKEPDLTDRDLQLLQGVFVKDLAGLASVRADRVDLDFGEMSTGNRCEIQDCGRLPAEVGRDAFRNRRPTRRCCGRSLRDEST